ncbi:hypothetical protein [Streptomyces iconiensis]|uniref:Uncharacterized protein n=1 Tax=Streptomyces iconiensis TaxID=1384038 RepID=A0ABT6ZVD9_9ACTN|nr:hypothetical protein [Streptomyces iconiensis]MDJ1133039.1 hypothetical protein [Streptomyces iconiensis]
MKTRLTHGEIGKMVQSLFGAGVFDRGTTLEKLLEAQYSSLAEGASDDLSLHVLCCNEYFLVTEVVEQPAATSDSAGGVRGDLA